MMMPHTPAPETPAANTVAYENLNGEKIELAQRIPRVGARGVD
jgi:hypothetical protein